MANRTIIRRGSAPASVDERAEGKFLQRKRKAGQQGTSGSLQQEDDSPIRGRIAIADERDWEGKTFVSVHFVRGEHGHSQEAQGRFGITTVLRWGGPKKPFQARQVGVGGWCFWGDGRGVVGCLVWFGCGCGLCCGGEIPSHMKTMRLSRGVAQTPFGNGGPKFLDGLAHDTTASDNDVKRGGVEKLCSPTVRKFRINSRWEKPARLQWSKGGPGGLYKTVPVSGA